jgi:hypothetical protein
MSSQISNDLYFRTQDEKNEYLKTRIESLDLSPRVQNALNKANIRTIGGILKMSESLLTDIKGLGVKGLNDIKLKLKNSFQTDGKLWEMRYEMKPLNKTDSSVNIDMSGIVDNNDIISSFATYFNVSKEAIESKSRSKDLVEIRDIIIYFLREYAGMSFLAIGNLFGGRDHSTIIHSYNKIERKFGSKKNFEIKFSDLINKLKSTEEKKLYIIQTVIPEIVDSVYPKDNTGLTLKYKEISERNDQVLKLYKDGLTLQSISEIVNVTRERVRQIVKKTIIDQTINDSISNGVNIDSDIVIEEERKKRMLKRGITVEKVIKPIKEKRWSKYYISCKACGTTTIPHVRKGLCEKCIGQFRGERRENIIKKYQGKCDICGISRHLAIMDQGKDLYISKDERVLCRKCFLGKTGKNLGSYKNFTWSRFYPACISCGSVEIPHHQKGLCEKCSNFLTKIEREKIISDHKNICDYCGLNRNDTFQKTGRDFYIMKDKSVACRNCFQARRRLLKKQNK